MYIILYYEIILFQLHIYYVPLYITPPGRYQLHKGLHGKIFFQLLINNEYIFYFKNIIWSIII